MDHPYAPRRNGLIERALNLLTAAGVGRHTPHARVDRLARSSDRVPSAAGGFHSTTARTATRAETPRY